MADTATLIVEIGSVTTRVTLADTVEGETRLVGQAEVPSTYEPPYEDATVAVLQCAAAISDATGHQLLEGEHLMLPRTSEGDGADQVIAVTSAAGPMAIVIAAVSSDISARSALHASRGVNSTVLQTITLNDTTDHAVATGDYSWIERQVQRLIDLRPDVIVLAGGLEAGAQDSLVRLAHIIGLTAVSARVDGNGQAHQDVTVRPVVFAGNSAAAERVVESLSNRAEPIVVGNVRPTLEQANLAPAKQALSRLYNDRILGHTPGLAALRRMSAAPIRTTTDTLALMTRFLAELYGRNVLTIDFGSSATSVLLFSQGQASQAVLGALGSGYGVGNLLAERSPAAMMRWLPFPISERELTHALLNKQLRPALIPTTREDVLTEHASAREAIALAAAALFDERPDAHYDFVLASGGVLAHAPHPGITLLTILDALQPRAEQRAIDVYVDSLGLANAAGALAFADAEGAYALIEKDLLLNNPLATVIITLGPGRAGEQALAATLRIDQGPELNISVAHGQIGRLELPPGRKGQLVLKPASGVRIGKNAPGATIETGLVDVQGSLLGVVIDARGRPLRLPAGSIERQRALWEWLVALGAESGPLPYEAAEALPDLPLLAAPAAPEPEEAVMAPGPTEPASSSSAGMDDLDKLRQSVEVPKKRGMFRKRK
ncbi:MAG: glutamate mutase L [Roseiflexaceae bacterium]|nr:glutamate mutase L [Roseiflexaceae bacterium]